MTWGSSPDKRFSAPCQAVRFGACAERPSLHFGNEGVNHDFSLDSRTVCGEAKVRRAARCPLHVEDLEGRTLLTLTAINFGATVTSTPVAMNGVLYFSAIDIVHGTSCGRQRHLERHGHAHRREPEVRRLESVGSDRGRQHALFHRR